MKKMVILNGSPRGSKGATGVVVNDMQSFIPEDISFCVLELTGDGISESLDSEQQQKLYEADILMFAFPLYVDIFPANLLYCAREMEANKDKFVNGGDIKVYAFVNCGLHEGYQAALAIDILKNWTARMEFSFGMAVGFGGSGALPQARKLPAGGGLKSNMPQLFEKLMDAVEHDKTDQENIYGNISISREEYQQSSEAGWRILAERNGLTLEDLDKRW